MSDEPKINLTYEERRALPVILKLIKRKPEAVALLMKDVAKAGAVAMLQQVTRELDAMQIMARAFSEASFAIAQIDKGKEELK
jgi:hypothetical protein